MLLPEDFIWLVLHERAVRAGAAEPLDQGFLDDLGEALISYSSLAEGIDADHVLAHNRDYPGYLSANVADWVVFVPWSIARWFPTGATLASLLAVGERVSIQPSTNLCISGSLTALGAGIEIGDLDYCQYLELTPDRLVEAAKAFLSLSGECSLFRARYGTGPKAVAAELPWKESWPILTARMSPCTSLQESERFMIEFLSCGSQFGQIPASTVILPSNFGDRSVGAARQSFVFQEAIAVLSEKILPAPLWPLLDVAQMAEYIDFLLHQALDYSNKYPVKALKRALNLCRMIGLHDFATEALDILCSAELSSYVRARRDHEVAAMKASFDGSAPVGPLASVDITRQPKLSDSDGPDETIRDFIGRLAFKIRQLEHEVSQVKNG